jgi:RNA polymerase sigma-70 factor (ECF subfamily)
MQAEDFDMRLNQVSTQWSLIWRAHQGQPDVARSARQQLLNRYGGAVRRYLLKVVHGPDAADEVFQEFALQLMNGALRGANPERGRFRNFVKGTLFHLVADYRKQQRARPAPLPGNGAALAADPGIVESDQQFVDSWRDELLARAWAGLAEVEARTGQAYYAVLRFRADHPDCHSPQMAEQLSGRLGRPFTAAGIRQILHRARENFADLLLDEVIHSLDLPTTEQLQHELAELGLLSYCQPALRRRDLSPVTA